MNFRVVVFTAICVFIGVASAVSPVVIDRGDGVCVLQEVQTVFVDLVFVNTFIASNTIINIGGITIDINNAPQTLSTVVTITNPVTKTSTTTVQVQTSDTTQASTTSGVQT